MVVGRDVIIDTMNALLTWFIYKCTLYRMYTCGWVCIVHGTIRCVILWYGVYVVWYGMGEWAVHM